MQERHLISEPHWPKTSWEDTWEKKRSSFLCSLHSVVKIL